MIEPPPQSNAWKPSRIVANTLMWADDHLGKRRIGMGLVYPSEGPAVQSGKSGSGTCFFLNRGQSPISLKKNWFRGLISALGVFAKEV